MDYVHIEVDRVAKITEKAMLVEIDGEEVWLPLSQISPEDRDQYQEGDEDVSMCITEWIAKEKGL